MSFSEVDHGKKGVSCGGPTECTTCALEWARFSYVPATDPKLERRQRPVIWLEVLAGVEGPCAAISGPESGTRIAGPKPWGGGERTHTWRLDRDDWFGAIRAAKAEFVASQTAVAEKVFKRMLRASKKTKAKGTTTGSAR